MRFYVRFLTLICGLMLLMMPHAAWAAGKAVIKPKISTSWQYETNFYKAETDTRAVHTYLVAPGLEVGYDTGKTNIQFDYTLSAFYYQDADALPAGATAADEDNYIGHLGNLAFRSRITDRLELGLDEDFIFSSDAAATDRFNNLVDRNKYFSNRVIPSLYYRFGEKFAAGVRYQNFLINYDPAAQEDYMENRGIFDLVYNFTRTASLDLEYQYWQTDYDQNSSDYASHQIKLVFRRQANYFSFEAGAGYHFRDFDDAALQSIGTFSYHLAILGQNPPAPAAKPRSHVALTSEWNFNDVGTGDSYYKAHRISVEAGTIFLLKIPVVISGYYQNAEYETTQRSDNTYSISGSIGYLITDWLKASIKTGYEMRDSTVAGNDYDNRFVIISVDIVYDAGSR